MALCQSDSGYKAFNLRSLLNKIRSGRNASSQIIIDGVTMPVRFRHNGRARRIILRLSKRGDEVLLTVPTGTSNAKALEFAASQSHWISKHAARREKPVSFEPGNKILLRGEEYMLVHADTRRTPVWISEDDRQLFVSGKPEHAARRITDWLKKQACADLSKAAHSYAEQMGVKFTRLGVRDQQSRWGSCSARGSLSFSWRLIMAPPFVLDYVAAHEVAHLRHMDHSERFWSLVKSHCSNADKAKKWLKANGRDLHNYGH